MKLAVVGMGHFGPRRLSAARSRPEVTGLVACDHHPHKMAAACKDLEGVELEPSFDQVLADAEIRAVVLCTPTHTHAELGLRVLEAGKHLLIEKPIATSVADVQRLVDTAERLGLALVVGHSFEHSAAGRTITRLLSEAALGPIHYVTMRRVNLGRHQKESSVLWDLATHDVSILLGWFDEEPTSVRAIGRSVLFPEVMDVAFLSLAFASGVIANIESSWLAPDKARLIQIVGARGSLEYRAGSGFESLTRFDRRAGREQGEAIYHVGEAHRVELDPASALELELAAFLRVVKQGVRGAGGARHALRVTRVLERAEAAQAQGSY